MSTNRQTNRGADRQAVSANRQEDRQTESHSDGDAETDSYTELLNQHARLLQSMLVLLSACAISERARHVCVYSAMPRMVGLGGGDGGMGRGTLITVDAVRYTHRCRLSLTEKSIGTFL